MLDFAYPLPMLDFACYLSYLRHLNHICSKQYIHKMFQKPVSEGTKMLCCRSQNARVDEGYRCMLSVIMSNCIWQYVYLVVTPHTLDGSNKRILLNERY